MTLRARIVLLALAACALPMPLLPLAARDVLEAAVELVCVVWAWHRVRALRGVPRLGVALVVAGAVITAVADTQAYVVDALGGDRQAPIRNVLIVLGYVLLTVGAGTVVRRATRGLTRGGWAEASIFGLGALAPVMSFIVLPLGRPHDTDLAMMVIYPIACVLLVTMLARLWLAETAGAPSLSLFCLCATFMLVADFVAAVHGTGGRDVVLARVAWMTCFVLFLAGIVHRTLPDLLQGNAADTAKADSSRRRVLLLTSGLVLPPVSLTVGLSLKYTPLLWLIAGIALMVALLVANRIVVLLGHVAQQAAQLDRLARSDELTGLPNRRSWNHELPRACEEAEADGTPLTVAMLDLDFFKAYNDEHGHLRGDALLREVAAAWSAALQPGEYLARYGGEEFVLLLRGLTPRAAFARVDAIRRLTPAPCTASAGLATWRPGQEPLACVLAADQELYRAKHDGRDRTSAAPQPVQALPA